MTVGRRSPLPLPEIANLLRKANPDSDAQNPDLYRLGQKLEEWLQSLGEDMYEGLPAPHTHAPGEGTGELDDSVIGPALFMALMAYRRASRGSC